MLQICIIGSRFRCKSRRKLLVTVSKITLGFDYKGQVMTKHVGRILRTTLSVINNATLRNRGELKIINASKTTNVCCT